MKKPNFFIIGAPKCGTTSLASWLSTHPDIFISPIKEPHYFSTDFKRGDLNGIEEYSNLFVDAPIEALAVGEASTEYLYSDVAVNNIERQFPGSRYVVMIRDPVDLAYSLYNYERAGGREVIPTFEEAWRESPARRTGERVGKWCSDPKWLDYQAVASVGWQLDRLFNTVDRARVLVLVLDDVKVNPRQEYLKVLDFLGVEDDGRSEFLPENMGREKKLRSFVFLVNYLGVWAKRIKRALGFPEHKGLGLLRMLDLFNSSDSRVVKLPDGLRREMVEYFCEDVEKASYILDRDFSRWFEVSSEKVVGDDL